MRLNSCLADYILDVEGRVARPLHVRAQPFTIVPNKTVHVDMTNEQANKRERSTSAAAREIAAAVRELKLAGQTINKVRRRMSPSAAAREIAVAVKDLGAATHAIYWAVRHMGKAVQIRNAKPKKRNR